MHLTEDARGELVQLGRKILGALDSVSSWAEQQSRAANGDPGLLTEDSRRRLEAMQAEVRRAIEHLRMEPAIARVVVEWDEPKAVETFVVCRGSAAGAPTLGDARLDEAKDIGKASDVELELATLLAEYTALMKPQRGPGPLDDSQRRMVTLMSAKLVDGVHNADEQVALLQRTQDRGRLAALVDAFELLNDGAADVGARVQALREKLRLA